jgi:hypothetical protein
VKFVLTKELANELVRARLVPDGCAGVTLHVGVDGALLLQYEVFVTPDMLIGLGDAFATCGMRQLERERERERAREDGR